ncbi:MAG TPA: hypothetical protein VKK79_09610 [Candidatus Lokiarchaeia archaeon]|nr:hypothetical protein [Candidatus Lokiarchaeia archaeon]
MSSATIIDLMQKIPQEVKDIEVLKEQYRQKKEQLDKKLRAELAGIEEKIGKIKQQRTEELTQKQADLAAAMKIVVDAKTAVKIAKQKVAEAAIILSRTKLKEQKAIQTAQSALKKETTETINKIQKDIKTAQQQIQAKQKALDKNP